MGSAGTPLGNMVIKLGLDDADFGKGVANSKKEVRYLAKEMQANMKIADMAGNQMGKLGTKYNSLTDIIKAQEKQVASLKTAYEGSFVDGKATDSTIRLGTELQNANGKLANYKKQLADTAGALADYQVRNTGLTGDINKLSDGLIKGGKQLTTFGSGLSKLGGSLTKTITAPVLAGFTAATNSAMNFKTEIGEIGPLLTNGGKITAEYQKQLDQMAESSKKWAVEYGVSTSEINNGLAELVRKGYDANQTLGVMPSILDATKASGEGFNDVMNVTTEVISQFNLKGKTYAETLQNTARVTDSLTYVANATSAGFVDLGLAMGYVGPVANSLGMSVEETAASVGILSDAGIGGQKAGTALRGALTRLLKPSKQNIEGFEKLGVSVKDFKNGTIGLPDILDTIKNNTKGWTDAQRTAAIALAFGTESQSAMNVLVGQGGDALRNLTDDTYGATGATKEIAKAMNDLPANKVARFKESIKVLGITIGEDLLPVVTPWIEKGTEMVKNFSELDDATQKNIVKWVGLAAAAGPTIKILGGSIGTIGKLSTGIGNLGKKIVDISAKSASKKAMAEVIQQMETGTVVAGQFGGAVSTASGAGGIGAMTGALGGLSPVLLGIVGVGGALALGYGAWKLFGEEAYNSAQRTKEWGSDVGESTGQALTDVKTYSTEAGGQFDLLSQGLTTNTDEMVGNFAKMGESIETNLTGKIETLKSLLNDLPEDVKSAGEQITNDEITNQEKYLETVKTNNERIGQIRQQAADNHRQITVEEAAQIKALSEESATAYVNSLGKSESETKQILSAMTGNVETASEDQAKAWLQSLGKQRQDSKIEYGKMQEDLKSKLVDAGYDLNSDYAKQMLELLQTSSDSATQLTEDQMSLILGKYPELAEEVFLANGQLISSMGDAGQSAVAQNKTMMESFANMSAEASKTAEENKDKLKLVMDEADDFGAFWNDLVLDPKTGEVKTNAQDEVNKAAESEQGWNQLMWLSKDANVTSNVKMMIAEAAIANGKWDSMSYAEQQALLDSNVTQTMTQALEAKGDWEGLSFEQKKALIYSNTPETMAETMLSLGMWDEYQPEIKDLKAENYDFLNTLSQSEDKMKNWNETPNAVKQIQGENYDFLNKIYSSEEAYNGWKSIPNDTKIMLADNDDLLLKLSTSKTDLDNWNAMTPDIKQMLANNDDLANKVFASEESLNAWNSLKPEMKNMLANNDDILAKVQSGEISLTDYNAIKPTLKKLLGDSANVQNASKTGSNALDTYNRNNPGLKKLLGNASSAQQASSQGVQSIANWNRTNPKTNRLNTNDNSSGVVNSAKNTYYSYPNGQNRENTVTTRHRTIWETIKSVFTRNATGTNYHPGGLAMVNDQRGPLYRELVAEPDGSMYIPQGRNVMLDLQRGSKIYTASETKRLVPHYEKGSYVPKNSEVVKNLQSATDNSSSVTVVNDNSELVSLMRQMLNAISRLKPEITINNPSMETISDLQTLSRNLAHLTEIDRRGLE